MVLFAIEQSKAAYWADFVFYLALVVGLSAALLVHDEASSRLATAAVVLLGVLSWTAIEYALHRLVLHRLPPFRTWHERHHLRPRALICTPTIVSAALFALLVYLPALALTNDWRAAAYTLGVLIGYLSYAVTHHAIHHWHIDHTWLRRRKHWHALHHGAAVKICYGVTSEFWDGLFGSRPVGPCTTNGPPRDPMAPMARPSRRQEQVVNANGRDTFRWATSAFGDPPFPSQAKLSALKTQLDECRRARGRMFSLRCMVDAMNDMFANRMMTLIVVVILFLCAVSLLRLLR